MGQLKACWFEVGNYFVRIFLTDKDEYWGDDWNDAPYECNCGPVYSEYIRGYIDIAVPLGVRIEEIKDIAYGQHWSNQDIIDNKIPFCVIRAAEGYELVGLRQIPEKYKSFKRCSLYFNDTLGDIINKLDIFIAEEHKLFHYIPIEQNKQ